MKKSKWKFNPRYGKSALDINCEPWVTEQELQAFAASRSEALLKTILQKGR